MPAPGSEPSPRDPAPANEVRKSPDWLSTLLVVFMTGAFAYPLCVRGINLSDEGFLLQEVMDILAGKVLYRDIEAFVAPGMWYLTAALFEVVEPSVLHSRVLAWLAYVGTTGVMFHITMRHCGFAYALGAVLSFLTLSLWAYPSWTFAWYSPWSIGFALLALDQLLRWDEGGTRWHLFACGLFVGLTTVFKQNYGAFSLTATALGVAAVCFSRGDRGLGLLTRTFRQGLWVAAGLCAIVLPTLAYFAWEGALGSIFYRFVVYPTEFSGTAHIPFPEFASLFRGDLVTDGDWRFTYMAPHAAMAVSVPVRWFFEIQGVERLYILGYFLPPLIFALGAVLGVRGRGGRIDVPLLAVSALAALVFLGVFPRADFTHLITVYPPAMLAAVFVAHRLTQGPSRARKLGARVLWSVGGVLAIVYVFFAGAWYLHFVESESRPLPYARGGVLVSPLGQHTLAEQVDAIVERVGPGEPILTVPDMAMLNFLAERPQAGPYYQMYDHMISRDQGRGVVEAAEAHGVRVVLVRRDNFFSAQRNLTEYAPVLARYLRTHFEPEHTINADRLIFLRRLPEPRQDFENLDLIAACALEGAPRRFEHLYFDSLFHPLDAERGVSQETRCRLRVPASAALRVRVGYRRPFESQARTQVRASILLSADGESETLVDETLPIEREQMGGHPPDPAFEIDLSRWAGRDVELTLRTRLRGRLVMHPLDTTGFGVLWQDPQLELH